MEDKRVRYKVKKKTAIKLEKYYQRVIKEELKDGKRDIL